MEAQEYQLSDLIEISSLLEELTTPNDVGSRLLGGASAEKALELYEHLRNRRLVVVQVLTDPASRVLEQRRVDPASLAAGQIGGLYDRLKPTDPRRKLYCTYASVVEQWPTLPSGLNWKALEALDTPPGPTEGKSAATSPDTTGRKKIPNMSQSQHAKAEEYLESLGPLPEKEAREAVIEHFHRHITRKAFRTLARPTGPRGVRRAKK